MDAFWIILTGSLTASTCGLLGCFLVLRRLSLIGDAISHAILPGIFAAYWLAGSRASVYMLMGAASFGLLCTYLIEWLHKKARVQEDAATGIIFTLLFAIGVILISLYAGQVDLDQDCVLYGEIAYVPLDRWISAAGLDMGPRAVWISGSMLAVVLAFISIGYRGLFITTFDSSYALTLGISTALWHYLLMGAVSLATVVSFESVGAILVVAFLIGPAATAYLLTDRLPIMLLLSALIGTAASVLGYFLASRFNGSIAGAMAIAIGILFVLALFFSPRYGVFRIKTTLS